MSCAGPSERLSRRSPRTMRRHIAGSGCPAMMSLPSVAFQTPLYRSLPQTPFAPGPKRGCRISPSSAPLQINLSQARSNLADFNKIPVAMNQWVIPVKRQLSNTAIDGASYGGSCATQLKIDTRRFMPGILCGFDVLLVFQIMEEKAPLFMVSASLQQLKLRKTGKCRILRIHFGQQLLFFHTAAVPKNINPNTRINDRCFGHPASPCSQSHRQR